MASVASRNLFDLLGDSEEAEPIVKEPEPTPAKETVVVKKVDRSRASPKEARIRFDYPQRGGYNKPSTSNRSEDTRSAPRDRNVGPRLAGRREEGGGGGGGDYPTRNSRGARPNDRSRGGRGGRRGREFDRHSGTGRYDSEKKDTQAWGNVTASYDTNESSVWNDTTETSGWNNNTTEASGWNDTTETPGWNDTTETSEPSGWNESTTDNNAGGWDESKTEEKSGWDVDNTGDNNEAWVEQPEVVEDNKAEQAENTATGESAPVRELEEEVVKTFDEYLAEKAQKSLDITLPEARKPNEGTDDSQWKNAVPLEKDEEEDFLFTGKEQSYRLKSKKSKSKNYLEIEPTFTERSGGGPPRGRGRGRGGRGGRGGRDDGRSHRDNYDNDNRDNRRRGGGGRGGYAGIVNLDDQRAFPSLNAEKV